ncbi:MAG: hypothetical protein KDA93_26435, partial [Planctomycetaceae bacterium]|nr:hypothetical protein [Planctomycetaceae bacterium]
LRIVARKLSASLRWRLCAAANEIGDVPLMFGREIARSHEKIATRARSRCQCSSPASKLKHDDLDDSEVVSVHQ